MSFDTPQVVAEFVTLTPEQEQDYREVQRVIHQIASQPNGLMFILNAVATTEESAVVLMHSWSDELLSSDWDARAIAGIIHERPLELPHLAE